MTRANMTVGAMVTLSALAFYGCDSSDSCGEGSRRAGSRCVPVDMDDAGDDAAVADGGKPRARDTGPSGEGGQELDGSCDGDECVEPEANAGCEEGDGGCVVSLSAPIIAGAESMGPGHELWTWDRPEGTSYFEIYLDGLPFEGRPQRSVTRLEPMLDLGMHTLRVRACTDRDVCSDWAERTARVERFGTAERGVFQAAARELATTALGHRAALACNDCFDGPNGEVLSEEGARASLGRAITNRADALEINVASVGGELVASLNDASGTDKLPRLSALLGDTAVQASDALLTLQIVEGAAASSPAQAPAEFAKALMALLDASPDLARNGRPLLLRASYAQRTYLTALQSEALQHAVIGPYLSFVVSDSGGDPLQFYTGESASALQPMDGIAIDYRASNLASRLERARATGASVILENVPGPGHGELVLAALREHVDMFITDYRVDQARTLIEGRDTMVQHGPSDISADGTSLTMHAVISDVVTTAQRALGEVISPYQSTPTATLNVQSAGMYGRTLDFVSGPPASVLTHPFSEAAPSGLLVSMTILAPRLASVGSIYVGRSAYDFMYVQLTSDVGAQLGFAVAAQQTPLRPSSCVSKNGSVESSFDWNASHWIVGSYRNGVATLLIDGRCAEQRTLMAQTATTAPYQGGLGSSFSGSLQHYQLLRWAPDLSGHGEN